MNTEEQFDASLCPIDAEAHFVGSIMVKPDSFSEYCGVLPEHLGHPYFRLVLIAAHQLSKQGIAPSRAAICRYMKEAGSLELAGGEAVLSKLVEFAGEAQYVQNDVILINKFYLKRQLLGLLERMQVVAYDSVDLTSEQILKQVQTGIDSLRIDTSTSGDPWDGCKHTLADAYKPRPPQEFVVNGIFALPSLNILYGAPGTMKSLLLADLCVCIAAGQTWLPSMDDPSSGFATRQTPVLWLDFDNGENQINQRFEALGRTHQIDSAIALTYYTMPSPWLDASDTKSIDELMQRIRKASAQVVVIDNLGVITGGAEENSAQMASVMANLRYIAETTNTVVILIHHQRKSPPVPHGRAGESLRGHSSIEASLDLALLVVRDEGSEMIKIMATKARGAEVAPFGAHFIFEHKTGTTELGIARFCGVKIEDMGSNGAIETAVLVCVSGNAGIAKTELKAAVRKLLPQVGLNRIGTVIDSLTAKGILNEIVGSHGVKRYQLAP